MKKIYVILGLLFLGFNLSFSQNKLVLHDSIFNGGHMYSGVAADFDKDGDNDFIASDWNGLWRFFENDSNAHFTPTELTDFEHYATVVLGDIDSDTDVDIILSANDPHAIEVWLNDGAGSFTKSDTHNIANGPGGIRTLQLFDADGDKDLDLLMCNGSAYNDPNSFTELWLNDSTGVFTLKQQFTKEGFQVSAAIGDIDGDGDPDLVFGQAGMPATVYKNDGNGAFTYSAAVNYYSGDYRFLDDIDSDGDLDLILTDSYNNFGLRICSNDGMGNFTSPTLVFGSEGTFKGQQMVDMDGDGHLDFVTGGDADNLSLYYRYNGCSFEKTGNLLSKGTNGVLISDFNGDSKPDLLFMNRDGYSKIFLNQLTPGTEYDFPDTLIDKVNHSYNACKGADLTLFSLNNFTNLKWTGPESFSSSDQNPVISKMSMAKEGYYYLTADYKACVVSDSVLAKVVQLDSTITVTENQLTANAINVYYQWYDCNNGPSPVDGATNKQFTPEENGSYSVLITDTNNCTISSSCVGLTLTSINDYNAKTGYGLYPNPSFGAQTIDLYNSYPEISVKVTDINGKIIDTRTVRNTSNVSLQVTNYPRVYFIEIKTADGVTNLKGLKAN
jgi:hypothetical protein